MAKGSGTTRSSASGNPRGLSASERNIIDTNNALFSSGNNLSTRVPIAGVFTTRQGRDIDLDKVAREGRQEDTWNKKPLTQNPAAGKIAERNIAILGEDYYKFNNGKHPSKVGQGNWMFRIGSKDSGSVVEFPVISYADAKRAARKIAARYGYRTITVMT